MECRYKVGDCVVYIDGGYWKVFKILEIMDSQCKYRCLDISISREYVDEIGYFNITSPVGRNGIVVDESNYMSHIMAKVL